MSSRIFQGIVLQLSEAAQMPLGVIDAEGTVISASDLSMLGERLTGAAAMVAGEPEKLFCTDGKTFLALKGWNPAFGYTAFTVGTDVRAAEFCRVAQVSLNLARSYYEEKHDRGTFLKNIITDNILPGDIYIRAKELHFPAELTRVVFLIRQTGGHSDLSLTEVLQGCIKDDQQCFVIGINETDVAIVRQVVPDITTDELNQMARELEERIKSQYYVRTAIGIGTPAEHLRELADSYKEAQVAIEVGKVFDTEKTIINYENLGIGRLIYQLPTTLCEIFLSEVFKKNTIDTLDQETLFTINMFFENSLNVSETSRKLFVHRNTLVYRLEKIKKLTGLDLREFDDAIIFKVALMVKKYLSSRETRQSFY